MGSPNEARSPRRILGLFYTVLLGWIVALVIEMITGPVGYFIFLQMLPAAVHAALNVVS